MTRIAAATPDTTTAAAPRLRIEGLTCRYARAERPAVEDLGLSVAAGEIVSLLGPSGCGKTTTLRCVAGLERAEAGRIQRGDLLCQEGRFFLPPEKRGIGLVFQDYALFPHLDVLRNVMFGLRSGRRADRRQRAEAMLDRVGMLHLAHRRVQALSGGQQQRVAVARAMAPGADVLLLDEPFSHLDTALRGSIRQELRDLVRQNGLAVVLVTHDQEEALSTSDRVAVMQGGRVIQAGRPEAVYSRPRTAFVAGFLGITNLIEAEGGGNDVARTPLGRVQLDRPASGPILLSIRPEHLVLSPAPQAAERWDRPLGVVAAREFKGHDLTYRVRVGEQIWTVQMEAGAPYQVGHAVQLTVRVPAVVVERDHA